MKGGLFPLSFFELGMLVCFGLSWPISVVKSYRMKTTQGKSLLFTLAIWVGYISGITHKLLYSRDAVLYIYIFNLTMVTLDLILYFVNLGHDRRRAAQAENDPQAIP